MKATWQDIESALDDGRLEKLDRATLEAFARVEPLQSQNPAVVIRSTQVRARIVETLHQLEAREAEARRRAEAKEKERAGRTQASQSLDTLDSEKTVQLLRSIELELRCLRAESEKAARLQKKQLHWARIAGVTIWIAFVLFMLFGLKVYVAK